MSIVYGAADKDGTPTVPFEEQLKRVPKLPIIDLCEDRVTLPVEGVTADVPEQKSPIEPAWQRWNDYGIGYFLAADADVKKPGLLQAVELYPDDKAALAHAYLNLARAHERNGELARAAQVLDGIRADRELSEKAPWWTVAWFTGLINAQNGSFDTAVKNFRDILNPD